MRVLRGLLLPPALRPGLIAIDQAFLDDYPPVRTATPKTRRFLLIIVPPGCVSSDPTVSEAEQY